MFITILALKNSIKSRLFVKTYLVDVFGNYAIIVV